MLRSPYLHHGIIDRDEGGEQVQIAGCEDKGEKNLTLPRDSWMAGRRKEGEADERKGPWDGGFPLRFLWKWLCVGILLCEAGRACRCCASSRPTPGLAGVSRVTGLAPADAPELCPGS